MSKLSKMKYAVSGFLAGSIFFGSIAFAATSTIDVSFDKLKFIINGVDKTTSDGMFNNHGTKVPSSFIYSGTTYIPMRMAGEMLGKPVDWDGKNKAVLIGSEIGDTVLLSDLAPASSSAGIELNKNVTINEQSYNQGFRFKESKYIEYNLDAKYAELTGIIKLLDSTNMYAQGVDLTISGDGNVLFETAVLQGANPLDIKIDVTGVLKLKIETKVKSTWSTLDFVNPTLLIKE